MQKNTLYYGDNLEILREYVQDESVDLVYLDPPFNSNRNYSVLFKDESGNEAEAQIEAFEDTWHWGPEAERTWQDLVTEGSTEVSQAVTALRQLLGDNQVMAYLVMMTARLVELHRALKSTGSLYLHCDPTASHYLKVVLDSIFDPTSFRNEIIWKRTSSHNDAGRYGRVHDVVLYYVKGESPEWNQIYEPYSEEYVEQYYRYRDADGRRWMSDNLSAAGLSGGGYTYEWNGVTRTWRLPVSSMERLEDEGRIYYTKNGIARRKRYLDESKGQPIQDVWSDIEALRSWHQERLGYPTQKPEALLERLIEASSNPGDVILDPFCGCGTAIAAAQKLGRNWIGIDVTHLSVALQKYRLQAMFPEIEMDVIGEPEDLASARQLASEDRYQFQWWALSLIRAKPLGQKSGGKTGKKGADQGIDGVINFLDKGGKKPQQVLVQVKSGHVQRGHIGELRGTIEREGAAIGIYVTLEEPTRPMRQEAVAAGYYYSEDWRQEYPRLQILTIEELLRGAGEVKMPPQQGTFREAKRARMPGAEQEQLEF